MRSEKLVYLIAASALSLGAIPAANATTPGIYIGGSAGAYRLNDGDLDDHDRLLRAYVGGQLTNWFAIEGSWTDFNRVDNPDGDRFEGDGKGLAGVFSIPLGTSSALFAKAGQFWWNSKTAFGGIFDGSDGHDPFYGVGVQIGLNDHLALRIEGERYDVADVKLDTASVGLQFKF